MAQRVTVPAIKSRKRGRRIVTVTAYDAATAALLDEAGVDMVLVGDSVGNVLLGYDSTIPVSMRDMLHHVRAVRRGLKRALLIADMPFLSYQSSPRDAVLNAGKFIKEGADAVKLEGEADIGETVRALLASGIPVMGHVGLMPQRLRETGGYGTRGKDAGAAFRIWRAARFLDRLGVFSIVLESVPSSLARMITRDCSVPTIGIGAGKSCDGQVLVFNDLVGLTPVPPRFARPYAKGRSIFLKAVRSFAGDVRRGTFKGTTPDLGAGDRKELENMIAAMPDK